MGVFYTGKGDGGKSFIGKKTIDKTCRAVSALGALDELNSLIGAVRHEALTSHNRQILLDIQENLFIIQANVAGVALYAGNYPVPEFPERKIREMEYIID